MRGCFQAPWKSSRRFPSLPRQSSAESFVDDPPPCRRHYITEDCLHGEYCKFGHMYTLRPGEREIMIAGAKRLPCDYLQQGTLSICHDERALILSRHFVPSWERVHLRALKDTPPTITECRMCKIRASCTGGYAISFHFRPEHRRKWGAIYCRAGS
jgi:hypothetical protein